MTRSTKQRRAILAALRGADGPLTPQEVHAEAARHAMTLGLATVYRNLQRLERAGDVVPVHLPNDTTRYEPAGKRHHHHFCCRGCEGVFEVEARCPVAPLEGATLPGGFEIESHDLTFYGLCHGCKSDAAPMGG